jgi:hypothetical protein
VDAAHRPGRHPLAPMPRAVRLGAVVGTRAPVLQIRPTVTQGVAAPKVRVQPVDDVDAVLQLAQRDVAHRWLQAPTDIAGRRLGCAELVVHDLHPPRQQQQDGGALVGQRVDVGVGQQAPAVRLGLVASPPGLTAQVRLMPDVMPACPPQRSWRRRKRPSTCGILGAACGNRTHDLRITRASRKRSHRSTSTDSTPYGSHSTRAPERTGFVSHGLSHDTAQAPAFLPRRRPDVAHFEAG